MIATELTRPTVSVKRTKGGSFLIEESKPGDIFTPEDLSEEQRQVAKTANEFVTNEVLPAICEIEAKNFAVTKGLLRKAGELGLLSVDVPEVYGGMGMDKVTSAVVAEATSKLASFSVAFGAHVGIGTLPIVWYGTEAQKRKYLPKLATGEWIAAYALSEATSGSDALNCRTRAVLSEDGTHYVLNGEKMWITNSGFADLFVVFAKSDGDKLSAFLLERHTPGFSVGAEEHKLGIHGSSTCPLILADCRVPVENLLGEAGKGHHIAFNALNIGRFKLGAACAGGARQVLQDAIQYAKQRKAFGKPIAEFGLIQEKLAECAAGVYAGESMVYRTIGMLDAALADLAQSAGDAREIETRIGEYAAECSIVKVWVTEMLQMVANHDVQIHGGYGYVEEYPAERAYRDARINPIFEGTNEINRLIITGWLMKRAMKGELPLLAAIKKLMDEVISPSRTADEREGPLAREHKMLAQAKKLGLFAAGVASQKYMQSLADQQEVMAAIANCAIEVYAMESCILRAEKLLAAKGEAAAGVAIALAGFYAAKAMQTVEASARKVIAAVAEGDMLRTQMAIVRRLAKHDPANTITLGRQIAQHVLAAGRYSL
jgi:butyryl-CoA dehydrogenase